MVAFDELVLMALFTGVGTGIGVPVGNMIFERLKKNVKDIEMDKIKIIEGTVAELEKKMDEREGLRLMDALKKKKMIINENHKDQ